MNKRYFHCTYVNVTIVLLLATIYYTHYWIVVVTITIDSNYKYTAHPKL